ncbi:MAG: hypothetical protein GF347_03845 [Candidatus Moranbacteria bacterium]|nr:hypothetical protein [Candidatus Moranbacteria bacterium]
MFFKPKSKIIENLLAISAVIIFLNIFYSIKVYKDQVAKADNARRLLDIQIISQKVYGELISSRSRIPDSIETNLKVIGTSRDNCSIDCLGEKTDPKCLDLNQIYNFDRINKMPFDPVSGNEKITFYAVKRNENNRLVIYACKAQLNEKIIIKR